MARYKAGLQTRVRILDATRSLLDEVGLEATTIKAICDRARIQPGSFYNLFDSKNEAIITVIGEAISAVDPDPTHEGTDTLQDLVEAYVRFMTEQPVVARIYLQLAVGRGLSDPEMGPRMLGHHRRRVGRFVEAMMRANTDLTESEAIRHIEILLAGLNGLAYVSFIDPDFDLRGHVSHLLDHPLSVSSI